MTRKRNPIEDPLQYPVQGRAVVRSGKAALSSRDVLKAKDDDDGKRPRRMSPEKRAQRKEYRAQLKRLGMSPEEYERRNHPSRFLLDEQARQYDAMPSQKRAQLLEHAALLARIAERRRLEEEEDHEIDRASSNTRAVRAFLALQRAARGEITIPDVPPEDSPAVARDALVSDTADLFLALNHAIRANRARRVLEQYAARLEPIFRRAKGSEKVGVTEKQARAWV